MSSTVNLYRCYCIEEATQVDIWSTTEPTACTNPATHTSRALDPVSTTIINTISANTVVAEESSEGWFNATTVSLDIPASAPGTVHSTSISWPAEVLLWKTAIYMEGDPTLDGDMINVIAGPDTTIGYITAPATTGVTTVHVSSTVLQYITRGIDATITDGTHRNDLGLVTAVDAVNSTISFQTALANDFAPGSLILLNVHTLKHMEVNHMIKSYKIGDKGFRGKLLPANLPLELRYTSNSGVATKIVCKVESYIKG